jgi:hypothetical protein
LQLPLVKAIETEITYILRNNPILLENAKIIIEHKDYSIGAKPEGEILQLLNTCDLILNKSKKSNYSIYSLYLILKYFICNEDYTNLKGFQRIFDGKITELILKQQNLLEELRRWGQKRNIFVHAEVIENENEFIYDYNNLLLLLRLLGQIKFLLSTKASN